MTRDQFVSAVEKYLEDVLREATRMFDEGVAHDRCVSIATQIVDGRDLAKARSAQSYALPSGVPRRQN